MKHDRTKCVDCKILNANQGSRSMGFSEEEIDFRMCRRAIQELEDQANERREWDYYHPS